MGELDINHFEFEEGTVKVLEWDPRKIWVYYGSGEHTIHTLLDEIDENKVPTGTKVHSLIKKATEGQLVYGVYLPGKGVIAENLDEFYGGYLPDEEIDLIKGKLSSGPDYKEQSKD